MGTAGLAIAWQKAHLVLGAPAEVGQWLRWLATAVWLLTALVYGLKFLTHRVAVLGEWRHPVRINFFPTISIGLLLLAIAWAEDAPGLAAPIWGLGAGLHLAFTLAIMGGWLHHTHYEIKHANPAWFIPVVGNIIVPVVGVRFAPPELSWFFFSIGLVFWLVLLTIVMYRLFFHEPLPLRLTPTLFILLAPPSVGCVAWMNLTGEGGRLCPHPAAHGPVPGPAAVLQCAALPARALLPLLLGLFLPPGGGDHRHPGHGRPHPQHLLQRPGHDPALHPQPGPGPAHRPHPGGPSAAAKSASRNEAGGGPPRPAPPYRASLPPSSPTSLAQAMAMIMARLVASASRPAAWAALSMRADSRLSQASATSSSWT